jgi:hypothetical protein
MHFPHTCACILVDSSGF